MHRKPYSVLEAETRDWTILDWLNQDEIWRDNEGRFLYMADFTDDHLNNLIGWLGRRAKNVQLCELFDYALSGVGVFGPMGDAAQDAYDQGAAELQNMTSMEYMRSKPLYKALVNEQRFRLYDQTGKTVLEHKLFSGYGPTQISDRYQTVILPNDATVHDSQGVAYITLPVKTYLRMVRNGA